MPLYLFEDQDGKQITVVMDTKQPIEAYHSQVVNGKTYKRVYTVPCASVDSRVGVTSDEFRRATTNKKMKVGEMQDLSKEMHLRREEKEGIDPVKEKFYENYEKSMGQPHQNVVKRQTQSQRRKKGAKAKEKLKKYGVEVSF